MNRKFRNIKIKTKLLILGIISIMGIVLMGAESVFTAKQINQASVDLSQSWLPSVIIAEELNKSISDYRINEYHYVATDNPEVMAAIEQEMQLLQRQIEGYFLSYEAYITDETDQTLMIDAKEIWEQYLTYSTTVLMSNQGRVLDKSLDEVLEESKSLFDRTGTLFLEVVNFNKNGAEEASLRTTLLYEKLTKVKLITIALIVICIITLMVYIIRAIEKPVDAIVEGARRASNGDLDVYIEYCSEDEIGILTDSVNALIQRLKDIISDEKYLLYEIGVGNFDVESECQQAYRGDFAPILYAIEGMKSRLKYAKEQEKGIHISGKPIEEKK